MSPACFALCAGLCAAALACEPSPARAPFEEPADAGPGPIADAGPGPSEDAGPPRTWPNALSAATSDAWIAQNHDALTEMRPRFLVVNFANGIGLSGGDNTSGGPVTTEQIRTKAEKFLAMISRASIHQPRLDANARPFLAPEIAKVVDLQDGNGHANASTFPRGPTNPSGYPTVGYFQFFGDAFAPRWGWFDDALGRHLRLGELVDRGLVHEVIMVANQVDGNGVNPADQVTANILEVAFVAQAYDDAFAKRAGEFVKNGIAFDRQKADMASATYNDHNSMPWTGRSLRIYFMNVSRGAGCLLHSLGHEFEFRYNEARIYAPLAAYHGATPHPYMQPLFRAYADFDMRGRYGVNFDSLYAGGDSYTYSDCDGATVCHALGHPGGSIASYQPRCGNVHYPPGATHGYDYLPQKGVWSDCESFMKPASAPQAFTRVLYADLTSDPAVDKDCGGDFLVYWFQNMPGLGTSARDGGGAAMKNWWPFMYY